MKLLDNYSIKSKLYFVIISISIISLVFFGNFTFNKFNEYVNFNDVLLHTDLSVKSAELIHELQIERGMSAGYLNSKGKKFSIELKEQRNSTNSTMNSFKDFASNNFSINEDDHKLIKASINEIEKLSALRSNIDGFNVTAVQQIKSYTLIIKSLLELLNEIKDHSSEFPELRNSTISLYNLSWYKEYVGQLRATLNSAFVKNELDMEIYKNFTQRYFSSIIYLNTFKDYTSTNLFKQLKEYEKSQDYLFVKSSIDSSLNNPRSTTLNINAAEWFKNITSYIDNLRKLEKTIADEITNNATEQSNNLFKNLIIILLVTIVIIIFIYLMAYKIISSLIRNINIAYKRALDISAGII